MKKRMMVVAFASMSIMLSGCGGSPKNVAEKFATALVRGNTDKAVSYCQPKGMKPEELKHWRERIDTLTKKINDDKYEAETIYESIEVKAEDSGYVVVDGRKYNGSAKVIVQFVKNRGKDRSADGMHVFLIKKDSDWVVADFLGDKVEYLLMLRDIPGKKQKE